MFIDSANSKIVDDVTIYDDANEITVNFSLGGGFNNSNHIDIPSNAFISSAEMSAQGTSLLMEKNWNESTTDDFEKFNDVKNVEIINGTVRLKIIAGVHDERQDWQFKAGTLDNVTVSKGVWLKRFSGPSFGDAMVVDPSSTDMFQRAGDIAIDSVGTIHVVMALDGDSNGNQKIYYTNSSNDGNTFKTPVKVSNLIGKWPLEQNPRIAVDSNLNIHVVLEAMQDMNDSMGLYYYHSNDGGATFNTVDQGNVPTYFETYAPDIDVDEDDVVHIIANNINYSGSFNHTYYFKSSDGGKTVGSPFNLSGQTNPTGRRQLGRKIIVDSNKTVHIFYEEKIVFGNYKLYYTYSNDDGATFTKGALVYEWDFPEDDDNVHREQSMVIDKNGIIHIALFNQGNTYYLKSQDHHNFSKSIKVNTEEAKGDLSTEIIINKTGQEGVFWKSSISKKTYLSLLSPKSDNFARGIEVMSNIGKIKAVVDQTDIGHMIYESKWGTRNNDLEYRNITFDELLHFENGSINSPTFNLGTHPKGFTKIIFTTDVPDDTDIEVQLRTGTHSDTWSKWISYSNGEDLGYLPSAPWLQWRAFLRTNDTYLTPVLRSISIQYDHYMHNGSYFSNTEIFNMPIIEMTPFWDIEENHLRAMVWISTSLTEWIQVSYGEKVTLEGVIDSITYKVDFKSQGNFTPVLNWIRFNTIVEVIPQDIVLDIGDDDIPDWTHIGSLTEKVPIDDFSSALNEFLVPYSGSEKDLSIPLNVSVENGGIVTFSNLLIRYIIPELGIEPSNRMIFTNETFRILEKSDGAQNLNLSFRFAGSKMETAPWSSVNYTNITKQTPGDYSACMQVKNHNGQMSKWYCAEYKVHNRPPHAVINTSSTKVQTFEQINLSSRGSYDPDGRLVSVLWDLGNGVVSEDFDISINYPDDGIYLIDIIVWDNNGSMNSTAIEIVVMNRVPVPVIGLENNTCEVNTDIQFSAENSTDIDGRITQYLWDLGNGTVNHGPYVTHRFSSPGNHLINLTVIDDDGASSSIEIIISVVDSLAEEPEPPSQKVPEKENSNVSNSNILLAIFFLIVITISLIISSNIMRKRN